MPGSIDYPPKKKDDIEELRARIVDAEAAAKKDASKEGELLALENQLRDAEYEKQAGDIRAEIETAETAAKSDSSKEANVTALEEKLRSFEKQNAGAAPAESVPSPVASSAEATPAQIDEVPSTLAVDDLVKMSKGGDFAGFVDALDANHDAWSRYASDHNVFSSPAVRALWQARSKAVHAAQQLEKASAPADQATAEQTLRAALEEMNGPLAMNVETAIQDNEKRLKGYAEGTHAEHRQTIEQTVEELTKLTEQLKPTAEPEKGPNEKLQSAKESIASEKNAMDAAEQAYLDAYKEYYSQKGAKESKEPEELQTLKRAYDESRLTYGNALTKSAQQRLEAKETSDGAAEKNARVLERYNRLVRYNEIIKPAAQKRYRAKLEAMDSRERGVFTKGLQWFAAQNKKLEDRFGKKGARFVRAAGTTLIAGGGAAAVGAFGTAGVLGALGWGTYRFGRSLASSFAGAGLGEAAAQAYGKLIGKGKQEAAEANLQYVGRTGTELDLDALAHFDATRESLEKRADDRTLEREKMLVRAFTALGVGAGTSAFLSHLPSGISGATEVAHAPAETGMSHPEPAPMQTPEHVAPTTEHAAPPSPAEHPGSTEPPHYIHQETPAKVAPAPAPHAETPVQPEQSAQVVPETPTSATNPEYSGPYKNVIPLPQGMDPNSPEAVAWLDRQYNPTVDFNHASAPASVPETAPAAAPEVPQPSAAPVEAPPVPEPIQSSVPPAPIESTPVSTPASTPEPTAPIHEVISAPETPTPAPSAVPEAAAPAPEIPSTPEPAPSVPVPETPHMPESVPSAAPTEAFVNSHNIRIDPTTPHIYAYADANGQPMTDLRGNPLYAVYGGTPEQKFEYTNQFLRQSLENHQLASVRLDAGGRVIEPSNATGLGIGPDQVSVGEGQPLPTPEPQSFTREVPFTPSTTAPVPEAPATPEPNASAAPASAPAMTPEAATPAPESVPSASPTEAFVNAHNVRVDPATPHVYLATGTDGAPLVDPSGNPIYEIYGGNTQNAFKTAQEFLKSHPGTTARIEVTRDVAGTVEHRSAELVSDANGTLGPGRLSIEGAPLPPPDPSSFTQEVPFTPSTQ